MVEYRTVMNNELTVLSTFCVVIIGLDLSIIILPQLITGAGYPIERHRVTTSDGYVLQMHRIPAGRRTARRTGPRAKGKRAVLLTHGLLGSSSDFIIMGPERSLGCPRKYLDHVEDKFKVEGNKHALNFLLVLLGYGYCRLSLAYILADAGYDVWLANLRGNVYSTHLNLTRNDRRFWEFSFHEHGKYDLTAQIDKVLSVTGQSKLLFIGYSMGTTSFFTMMSERPEYNEKVFAFVALAPAVFLNNVRPLAELTLKTWNIPQTLRGQGMLSLTIRPELRDLIVSSLCQVRHPEEDMCMRLIYGLVGEDYEQNDWDMMSVILGRFQPASWRQLEHFGKIALTGVFTSWEDGLWGEVKPYNISNVKVPVTILYGENDLLTEKSQIMRLAAELKTNGMLEEVRPGCNWPRFNHLDFVFAKDLGKLFNRPLLKHVEKMFNKYGPS